MINGTSLLFCLSVGATIGLTVGIGVAALVIGAFGGLFIHSLVTKKKIGEAKSVDDGYLVCTVNSFISDKLKPYDFAKGDDYHSYTRYSVVMDNCINNVKNNDPVVETQKLLKGEYGFMCQYDDEPDFETIWSSIFDLSNLMIYRAEGDPRRKKFITDKRLHNIVIGRKDAEK